MNAAPDAAGRTRSRLWWWFAAAIALHLLFWTCWFGIAARHPVADVPLSAQPER